jgi:hypothetical protein
MAADVSCALRGARLVTRRDSESKSLVEFFMDASLLGLIGLDRLPAAGSSPRDAWGGTRTVRAGISMEREPGEVYTYFLPVGFVFGLFFALSAAVMRRRGEALLWLEGGFLHLKMEARAGLNGHDSGGCGP